MPQVVMLRIPSLIVASSFVASLVLTAAACSSESDDAMPEGCLTFTGRYGAGAPGSRSFSIDSIASACTDRREVYLCHVGTFTANTSSYQSYLADLAVVGAVADPFPGVQFFESNGELGYVCAEVDREEREELQACLTTQSNCKSLREAEARLGENLREDGVQPATLP
jgi:hypothetical protein